MWINNTYILETRGEFPEYVYFLHEEVIDHCEECLYIMIFNWWQLPGWMGIHRRINDYGYTSLVHIDQLIQLHTIIIFHWNLTPFPLLIPSSNCYMSYDRQHILAYNHQYKPCFPIFTLKLKATILFNCIAQT